MEVLNLLIELRLVQIRFKLLKLKHSLNLRFFYFSILVCFLNAGFNPKASLVLRTSPRETDVLVLKDHTLELAVLNWSAKILPKVSFV